MSDQTTIKIASKEFTTAEVICGRGIVGMLFMAAVARVQGLSLATSVPRAHAGRSAFRHSLTSHSP